MAENYDINALGKQVASPTTYSPELLEPIPRHKPGTSMHGQDIWSLYELSWLDASRTPQMRIAVLTYDASSTHIVESKSLKLYLNSLNHHVFETEEDLRQCVITDLSAALNTGVNLTIYPIDKAPIQAELNSEVEFLKHDHHSQSGVFATHTFRSMCPVTSQPDFATLIITYTGKQINHTAIIAAIDKLQNSQEFHEHCIEALYHALHGELKPEALTVQGLFSRRGGIAISPVRSSLETFPVHGLIARQ